jgi:ribosomal protein L11 methyltransferase
MSLVEIRVPIAVAAAEEAERALAEAENTAWGVFEDRPTASAWLAGFFSDEVSGGKALRQLRRQLRGIGRLGTATMRVLPEADWRESYKAHFHPWRSGRLHWVPEWERGRYPLSNGDIAVWLDPGLAFGTGNHETTRLCCKRLTAFATAVLRGKGAVGKPRRVIDAGCGSGILAISAVKLGLGPVLAFDNDAEAVAVSRANAQLNELGEVVEFCEGDLSRVLEGRQAELVLANILADVLRKNTGVLVGAVAPGGWLVLSGILAAELAAVRTDFAAAAPGWAIDSRYLGEWADLRLVRPGSCN